MRYKTGQDWKLQTLSNLSDAERFICALPDGPGSSWPRCGRILEDQADLELLRSWLKECTNRHNCQTASLVETWMPGFPMSLIDCSQLAIKPYDKGDKYAAFSYVWGETSVDPLDSEKLPKAIQDAIYLTRKTGLRFLWIDRYCVSQDEQIKGEQIRNMDQIYSRAEFTIVSLKSDPKFGLPGLNGTLRRPQPRAKIGSYTFVSTLSVPSQDIKNSAWIKRGWTFQEAFLSRRLIFFTDEQMYFQCHNWDRCESVIVKSLDPFDPWGELEWQSLWDRSKGYCNNAKNPRDGSVERLWKLIRDYSKRQLTYPGDYLDAFSGVLRSFAREPCHVHHFWGIPLVNIDISGHPTSIAPSTDDTSRFAETFIHSLSKGVPPEAKRREGFPSWSWVGWIGPLAKPPNQDEFWSELRQSSSVKGEVFIEMSDGHWQTLENYIKSDQYQLGSTVLSPRIQLIAWVTEFNFDWNALRECIGDMRSCESLFYPQVDRDLIEENLILDTMDDERMQLHGLVLAQGTTLSQIANSYGVSFEEPSRTWGPLIINIVYGGERGREDGNGRSKGNFAIGNLITEPAERIGSIYLKKTIRIQPLSKQYSARVLTGVTVTNLRWEKRVIYLQ